MLCLIIAFVIFFLSQPLLSTSMAEKVIVRKDKPQPVIIKKAAPHKVKVKQKAISDKSIEIKQAEKDTALSQDDQDDNLEPVTVTKSSSHKVIINDEVLGSILNFELRNKADKNRKAVIWLSLRAKEGDPLKSLDRRDFTVIESINGLSREIPPDELFIEDRPIASVLLCDVSGSIGAKDLLLSKRNVSKYIAQMKQEDISELVFFSSNVSVIKSFTENKLLLKAVLAFPSFGGGTALNDAIVFGLQELRRLDDRYLKILILFTDGQDTDSSKSFEEAAEVASSSSIPIIAIGVGDVDSSVLQRFSRVSHGLYFHASDTNALGSIYDSISKIVRGAYVLSYPSLAKPGDKVDIEITASLKDRKNKVGKFYGHYLIP